MHKHKNWPPSPGSTWALAPPACPPSPGFTWALAPPACPPSPGSCSCCFSWRQSPPPPVQLYDYFLSANLIQKYKVRNTPVLTKKCFRRIRNCWHVKRFYYKFSHSFDRILKKDYFSSMFSPIPLGKRQIRVQELIRGPSYLFKISRLTVYHFCQMIRIISRDPVPLKDVQN